MERGGTAATSYVLIPGLSASRQYATKVTFKCPQNWSIVTDMAPERRTHKRTKMVLPVKVSIRNGTELAYTMDITAGGARLGGVRAQLKPGEVISLTRGSQKAKFRIVWVQQLATSEFHAGIEALQPNERFWGVDLSCREREAQENVDTLMSLLKGSSRHK